jgi:RNA polymerase sigma-70 factor (ECF subfamily)
VRWFGTLLKAQPSDCERSADTNLALRLKRKEDGSFVELYDLYGKAVYRYLMHTTGSITTAEELTQEVFVSILHMLDKPEPLRSFDPRRGTLEGYLIGIARNFARQEHRRSLRLLPLETFEGYEGTLTASSASFKDDFMNHVSALVTQSEVTLLYRYILELPEHYRSVVILCALQEKSYHEVAGILGCSEGTVASRLNRAKLLLSGKMNTRSQREADRKQKGGVHAGSSLAGSRTTHR